MKRKKEKVNQILIYIILIYIHPVTNIIIININKEQNLLK